MFVEDLEHKILSFYDKEFPMRKRQKDIPIFYEKKITLRRCHGTVVLIDENGVFKLQINGY
jgi:hypothetical protein